MGATTSNFSGQPSAATVVMESSAKEFSAYNVWSCIKKTSVAAWCHSGVQIRGFNKNENIYSRRLRVEKKLWSPYVVKEKCRKGKEDILCEIKIGKECVSQNKMWKSNMQVIAMEGDVCVIQMVLAKMVKLIVYDTKVETALGIYTFTYIKEACVQECFLSPGAKFMLTRQNFWLRRKLGHIGVFDGDIRFLQIKDGLCKRLFVIKDNLAYGINGSGLAFDPTYFTGRFVVFSSMIQSIDNRGPSLNAGSRKIFVYDAGDGKVLRYQEEGPEHVIHHVKYSPNGKLIAVVCISISIHVTCTMNLQSVIMYCSHTLDTMKVIQPKAEPCKMSLISQFPQFSHNGEKVAVLMNGKSKCVNIFKVPVQCMNLQEVCRLVIRRNTRKEDLVNLPIPLKMMWYLAYVNLE